MLHLRCICLLKLLIRKFIHLPSGWLPKALRVFQGITKWREKKTSFFMKSGMVMIRLTYLLTGMYLFKVINRNNTRRWEVYSKLTIKTHLVFHGFHALFWCLCCWRWTSNWWLVKTKAKEVRYNNFLILVNVVTQIELNSGSCCFCCFVLIVF